MTVQRILVNIISDDLLVTCKFYEQLLDFERVYESDWFFNLKHSGACPVEIGIIKRGHEIAPATASGPPGGIYLTLVVDDVASSATKAKALGARIISEPTDTFYGQRRMLLLDPDGNTLDISSVQ